MSVEAKMEAAAVDSHCQTDETPIYFGQNAEDNSHMDDLDRRLIQALREDARAPTAKLARSLSLSRTTSEATRASIVMTAC